MTTHRMLPPVSVLQQSIVTPSGRAYAASPGSVVDAIGDDARVLSANGWLDIAPSGTTAERPVGALGVYQSVAGSRYFDTSLNKFIVFDGQTWRDPASGASV